MTEVIIRSKRTLVVNESGKLVQIRAPRDTLRQPQPLSEVVTFDENVEELVMPAAHVIATCFSPRSARALAEGLSSSQLQRLRGRRR